MGADDARLSVVVASLGRAALARTITSVLASAGAAGVAVEVVVCWQAATEVDGLPAGPVRVLDVFPVGLSYARNRGVDAARAPLVAFVDDDEVVDAGWVGGVLRGFADHPEAAGVFGAVEPLDDDGVPYCVVTGDEPRLFRRPSTPPWVVGTGGNMAFRRDDLLAAGGFDVALGAGSPGRSGEETDLIARLLRAGRPLLWTPDAVAGHPTKSPGEHLASRRPYAHGTGAVARRHRDAGMAARYAVAIGQSYLTGWRERDRQRRREAVRTAAGFVTGLARGASGPSPDAALDRVPPAVAAAVGPHRLRPARGQWSDRPRFRYAAGPWQVDVLPDTTAAPGGGSVLEVADRAALWVVRPRGRR